MALVLLAVASYSYLHPRQAAPTPAVLATSSSPDAPQLGLTSPQSPSSLALVTVDQSAMHGMGRLAFSSQGRLYTVEESGVRLIDQSAPNFSWSHSGRWLAFWGSIASRQLEQGSFQITDGTSTLQVPRGVFPVKHPGPCGESYAWSPVGDQLAIALGNALWLQAPGAPPRRLLNRCVMSFAWSPDASRIAVVIRKNPDILTVVSVDNGEQAPIAVGGSNWPLITVAGWWPDGRGVLYAPDLKSTPSLAADNIPIYSVPLAGGEPTTFSADPEFGPWFANSPDGKRFAFVRRSGSEVQNDPLTAVCLPPSICADIPRRVNTVLTKPAWSPDGARLALLEAACCYVPSSPKLIAQWDSTHRIVVTDRNGVPLEYLDWGKEPSICNGPSTRERCCSFATMPYGR